MQEEIKNFNLPFFYFFKTFKNIFFKGYDIMANKSLEELLAETEQRIMNNEFKKTFTLTYDGEDYDFILQPLSQSDFMSLYTKSKGNVVELNEGIVKKCLINEEGEPYPENLVKVLIDKMPAGFTKDVTERVYEISGIETTEEDIERAASFLEKGIEL